MTIFLEIAKQFLTSEITTIIQASEGADQSLMNSAFGLMGLGRNTDLSTAKRQLLGGLQRSINEFSDSDKGDKETCQALIDLILKYLDDISTTSQEKNYKLGFSGEAIQNLEPLLRSIFKKCKDYWLLDFAHDTDPMNVFRYYVALYSTKKIIQSHHPSFVSYVMDNPQVSVAPLIASEKERLIAQALSDCLSRINRLDKWGKDFNEAKQQVVRDDIERLQRANAALYARQGWNLGAPVRFGFFSSAPSTAQSVGGLLDESMRQALAELDRNKIASLSLERKPSLSEDNTREHAFSH
jgi:hypothetical protein